MEWSLIRMGLMSMDGLAQKATRPSPLRSHPGVTVIGFALYATPVASLCSVG